jgi:hypothetical protein
VAAKAADHQFNSTHKAIVTEAQSIDQLPVDMRAVKDELEEELRPYSNGVHTDLEAAQADDRSQDATPNKHIISELRHTLKQRFSRTSKKMNTMLSPLFAATLVALSPVLITHGLSTRRK